MNLTETMRKFKAGEITDKEAIQSIGEVMKTAKGGLKQECEKAVNEILGMDSEPADNGDRKFGRAWERSQRGR